MNKTLPSAKPALWLSWLVGATILVGAGCAVTKQEQSEAAPAATREQAIARVEKAAVPFMKRHRVQGLAVTVVDSRGPVWTRGFGVADKQQRRPFTEDTRSLPGSVSKLLTATAVMILADRGMVDLDAPLVR